MFDGNKMKRLRRIKDMTQEQLGGEIGITATEVSKYERNEVEMRVNRLFAVCDALGCKAEDLRTTETNQIKERV